ncbi:MAG: hypothetical protein QOF25_3215 [Mycobacterium sp.]|jgi:hypothetical protein|nr:hypothetical protein [Mycobacterium sp.]
MTTRSDATLAELDMAKLRELAKIRDIGPLVPTSSLSRGRSRALS